MYEHIRIETEHLMIRNFINADIFELPMTKVIGFLIHQTQP